MASSAHPAARIAFQGEHGAFSEAAAIQLLGEGITTVPRATFDLAFRAIADGRADALLAPVENTLAGSVVRVYDLLLQSNLAIVAETILHVEHHLIGCPGATLDGLKSVASHPMALAQCESFFIAHPGLQRVPAEDTAGSVRDVLASGNKFAAGIAGRRAALRYGGVILSESIQDNAENFTRFVLLVPNARHSPGDFDSMKDALGAGSSLAGLLPRAAGDRKSFKMSIALRLAHQPGALLAALEPFSRHGINLQKIESRPIHGRPWEYQFFLDVQSDAPVKLEGALKELELATSFLRILGIYQPSSVVMP